MTDYLDIELACGGYYACSSRGENEVSIVRLLDFNIDAYHATLFDETFEEIPEPEAIEALSPFIGHVPVDARALLNYDSMVLVTRKPLTPSDLEGYSHYLRAVNVPEDEKNELISSVIDFSSNPPLRLRLYISDDELQVEMRN